MANTTVNTNMRDKARLVETDPLIEEGTNITAVDSKQVVATRFTLDEVTQDVESAALAFGWKLGKLPKGNIAVLGVWLDLTYVADGACDIQADIGVGTTVASGAVSVLGGTAAFEDCLTGQTATAFNGTTDVNYSTYVAGETDDKDGTSTAKTLYLNIAGNWDVEVELTYSGEVTVLWTVIDE